MRGRRNNSQEEEVAQGRYVKFLPSDVWLGLNGSGRTSTSRNWPFNASSRAEDWGNVRQLITKQSQKVMEYISFTLLIPLVILMGVEAQRTTTSTSTSTLTSTVTVTNNVSSISIYNYYNLYWLIGKRHQFVCAKLVNVTGVCRRRRGFLIDEPVVLSFDDELDDSIDDAFRHALHPGQFMQTTRTLGWIISSQCYTNHFELYSIYFLSCYIAWR